MTELHAVPDAPEILHAASNASETIYDDSPCCVTDDDEQALADELDANPVQAAAPTGTRIVLSAVRNAPTAAVAALSEGICEISNSGAPRMAVNDVMQVAIVLSANLPGIMANVTRCKFDEAGQVIVGEDGQPATYQEQYWLSTLFAEGWLGTFRAPEGAE